MSFSSSLGASCVTLLFKPFTRLCDHHDSAVAHAHLGWLHVVLHGRVVSFGDNRFEAKLPEWMSCLNAGMDAAATGLHVSNVAVTERSVLLLAADVSTMCIPDVCKRLDQSLVSLLPWANK